MKGRWKRGFGLVWFGGETKKEEKWKRIEMKEEEEEEIIKKVRLK
jgi:hypothetical protein